MKKIKILSCLIIISMFFSSCSQLPSPDSTIKSPESGVFEKYNKSLGIKLQDFIPSDSVLASPRKPSNAEPIVKKDLDGDGIEEIIITYKTNTVPVEARALILKKYGDKWINEWDKLHGAFDIESVDFADITGDGCPEAIFTWGYPPDNDLVEYNIVSKLNKHLRNILKDDLPNQRFEIKDIEGIYGKDGKLEIVNKLPPGFALRWYNGAFIEAEDISILYRAEYYKKLVEDKIKNTPEKDKTPDFFLHLAEIQINAGLPDEAIKSLDKGLYKIKMHDFTPPRPETWEFDLQRARALSALNRLDKAIPFMEEVHKRTEKMNIYTSPGYYLELVKMYIDNGNYDTASELLKDKTKYTYPEDYYQGNLVNYENLDPSRLQRHIDELKLEKEIKPILENLKNARIDKLSQTLSQLGNEKGIEINTVKDDINKVLICSIRKENQTLLHYVFWIYNNNLYKQIYYSSEGRYHGFDNNFIINGIKIYNDNGAIYIGGICKVTDNIKNNVFKFIKIKQDKCELIYSQNNINQDSKMQIDSTKSPKFTVEFDKISDSLAIKKIYK